MIFKKKIKIKILHIKLIILLIILLVKANYYIYQNKILLLMKA